MSRKPRLSPRTAAAVALMQAEPMREFMSRDLHEKCGIPVGNCRVYLKPALLQGLIFSRTIARGQHLYRATPYEGAPPPAIARDYTADPRYPQVIAGWVPPKMVPPRGRAA